MPKRRRSQPLRYQVRNEILELLTQRNYQPGDQIPTEQELMDVLDVSRSTLREGLQLLEEERIIRTRHGTGRFLVGAPRDFRFDLTRFQSVTEMLAEYNIQVSTRVLDVREIPADSKVASSLEIEQGAPVLVVERMRYAEQVPVIYSVDILNRSRLPEIWDVADFEGSLLAWLEQRGIVLDFSLVTIRAVLSDDFLSARHISTPCVPWILLEQVNYDQEGNPMIYSQDYHRSDYIAFHTVRRRR